MTFPARREAMPKTSRQAICGFIEVLIRLTGNVAQVKKVTYEGAEKGIAIVPLQRRRANEHLVDFRLKFKLQTTHAATALGAMRKQIEVTHLLNQHTKRI